MLNLKHIHCAVINLWQRHAARIALLKFSVRLALFAAVCSMMHVAGTSWSTSLHAATVTHRSSVPDSANQADDSLAVSSESFVRHLSKGWFPSAYSLTQIGIATTLNLYTFDRADNLRSMSFLPTRNAFTTESPFKDGEEDIKKKFSADNDDGDTFSEGYSSDGLVWSKGDPRLPALIRVHALYDRSRTTFYAADNTKKFVDYDGSLKSIREINVLNITQQRCNVGLSFMIPVYGIYVDSELASVSSLYFLGVGVNGSFLLRGRATQYTQIAGPKDLIRMSNGTDTIMVSRERMVATMTPSVVSITISGGWMAGFRGVSYVSVEPFVSVPLSSVLSDASWKQTRVGILLSTGFERE